MRIAWFTPFGRESAIGRASRLIVEELARSVEVDVWHPADKLLQDTRARTISYSSATSVASISLDAYDLAVYNFGNHLEYHRQIFEISRRTPGISVIHDIVLHHFFAKYYLEYQHAPPTYVRVMERWYGESGKAAAISSCGAQTANPIWLSDDVVQYPLFEEALQGAYGVVAHSEFAARKIREAFAGRVSKLPLPYDAAIPARVPPRKSLGVPEGRLLVVTIGRINRNKRIDRIIEALGQHPQLASRISYVVLGQADPDYLEELTRAVRDHHLTDTVRFTGAVSDERLGAFLAHADICLNLRFPAFEGASASAIEEMLHGKPVIVSDTGCYRELPDDCVGKVRPDREAEDLIAVLTPLIEEASLRRRFGESGRQYALSTFRADRYAAGIIELAEEILRVKPLFAYADRVGQEMARMGLDPEAPLVSTVSEMSAELFGD